MPLSLLPSFLVYCFVGAITPGPANLCSLSAALRYGKKAALRQWRGLITGFFCISMLSGVTTWLLGTALSDYVGMLAWVGAAYMLWLAWHMLRSSEVQAEDDPAYPTFRTGLLLQLTNVKIMIYCVTCMAAYVLPYNNSFWALFAMGVFLPIAGPAANLVWLFTGASLQKLFVNHRKTVDIVMALSLALCAVSLVWPH